MGCMVYHTGNLKDDSEHMDWQGFEIQRCAWYVYAKAKV